MSNKRPKVSVYIAISIDGFIAREDGSLDWLESIDSSNEDYGMQEFIDSIDGVILGRKTYEVAETAYETSIWPYTGKKLIILSNSLQIAIPEAQIYSGDLPALLEQLHQEGLRHIWVDGGNTISQFLRLNLVDEMILSIIPVLLGSGIRLFDIKKELPCYEISAQSYPSGLVRIKYGIGSQKKLRQNKEYQ